MKNLFIIFLVIFSMFSFINKTNASNLYSNGELQNFQGTSPVLFKNYIFYVGTDGNIYIRDNFGNQSLFINENASRLKITNNGILYYYNSTSTRVKSININSITDVNSVSPNTGNIVNSIPPNVSDFDVNSNGDIMYSAGHIYVNGELKITANPQYGSYLYGGRFSNDGGLIYFNSYSTRAYSSWVDFYSGFMPIPSGNVMYWTATPLYTSEHSWGGGAPTGAFTIYRDSDYILYQRNSTVFLKWNNDTGPGIAIISNIATGSYPSILGSQIIYNDSSNNIYIKTIEENILDISKKGNYFGANYSSDFDYHPTRGVVYIDGNNNILLNGNIIMNGKGAYYSGQSSLIYNPRFSKDGNYIYFLEYYAGGPYMGWLTAGLFRLEIPTNGTATSENLFFTYHSTQGLIPSRSFDIDDTGNYLIFANGGEIRLFTLSNLLSSMNANVTNFGPGSHTTNYLLVSDANGSLDTIGTKLIYTKAISGVIGYKNFSNNINQDCSVDNSCNGLNITTDTGWYPTFFDENNILYKNASIEGRLYFKNINENGNGIPFSYIDGNQSKIDENGNVLFLSTMSSSIFETFLSNRGNVNSSNTHYILNQLTATRGNMKNLNSLSPDTPFSNTGGIRDNFLANYTYTQSWYENKGLTPTVLNNNVKWDEPVIFDKTQVANGALDGYMISARYPFMSYRITDNFDNTIFWRTNLNITSFQSDTTWSNYNISAFPIKNNSDEVIGYLQYPCGNLICKDSLCSGLVNFAIENGKPLPDPIPPTPPTPPADLSQPYCGNGIKDTASEQCDGNDGILHGLGQTCSNTCQIQDIIPGTCGNNTLNTGEQCDGTQTAFGYTCSNSCIATPIVWGGGGGGGGSGSTLTGGTITPPGNNPQNNNPANDITIDDTTVDSCKTNGNYVNTNNPSASDEEKRACELIEDLNDIGSGSTSKNSALFIDPMTMIYANHTNNQGIKDRITYRNTLIAKFHTEVLGIAPMKSKGNFSKLAYQNIKSMGLNLSTMASRVKGADNNLVLSINEIRNGLHNKIKSNITIEKLIEYDLKYGLIKSGSGTTND